MTFEGNIHNYFIPGEKYLRVSTNTYITCTGIVTQRYGCTDGCISSMHGRCNGKVKPRFEEVFEDGICVCRSDGKDWFIRVLGTNTRW